MSAFNTEQNFSDNISIIKDRFKDLDTFNFKFGLHKNQMNNLDEDPVIYGFDIVIHDTFSIGDVKTKNNNTSTESDDVRFGRVKGDYGYNQKFSSPLINGAIPDFINFIQVNEVSSKLDVYNDFIRSLKQFFNDTTYEYNSFKSHYIKSVSGLHSLIENATGFAEENKQFTDYGKDKITIECYEDTYLNSGYLAALYKNFTYSKVNGKLLIPENLLKFDMSIIISEVRNFNKVVNATNDKSDFNNPLNTNNSVNRINVFNDNISRYVYNLYECQFRFPTYSHEDIISNETADFAKSFSFDIYYKFSTMEMEKFTYDGNRKDKLNYINNSNISAPNKRYDKNFDNGSSLYNSLSGSDKLDVDSRVYDLKYRIGNAPYRSWSSSPAEDDAEVPLTGINKVLQNTKKFALTRIRQERDSLVNKTLDSIRTNVGLRRINAPINVYDTDPRSITDYFFGQLQNFANDGVNNLLKSANNKLGGISKNIDIDRLKDGKSAINTGKYSSTDPDVRNANGETNNENVYDPTNK